MLYPAELLGHIHKISTCMQNLDSNDLPLRRRTLYPAELRRHSDSIPRYAAERFFSAGRLVREIRVPLKPYGSFEPPAHGRFAEQLLCIDPDLKYQVTALYH